MAVKLHLYTCHPNRLASSPRIFTKVMKVVFTRLQKGGHLSSGYVDDFFLVGTDALICVHHVSGIAPGSGLHHYLCEITDCSSTETWTHGVHSRLSGHDLSVVPEKHGVFVEYVRRSGVGLGSFQHPLSIEAVISKMVANLPSCWVWWTVVLTDWARVKATAVKAHSGNFNAYMTLSEAGGADILWFVDSGLREKGFTFWVWRISTNWCLFTWRGYVGREYLDHRSEPCGYSTLVWQDSTNGKWVRSETEEQMKLFLGENYHIWLAEPVLRPHRQACAVRNGQHNHSGLCPGERWN